jgi:hypothetical protein
MVDYKIISVAESPILEIFPPNQVADVPEKTNKSDSTMVPSAEFDSEVADEYSNNE